MTRVRASYYDVDEYGHDSVGGGHLVIRHRRPRHHRPRHRVPVHRAAVTTAGQFMRLAAVLIAVIFTSWGIALVVLTPGGRVPVSPSGVVSEPAPSAPTVVSASVAAPTPRPTEPTAGAAPSSRAASKPEPSPAPPRTPPSVPVVPPMPVPSATCRPPKGEQHSPPGARRAVHVRPSGPTDVPEIVATGRP